MFIEVTSRAREVRSLYMVALLLILQLVLLSLQIEDQSGTLLLKRWALTAQAPFLNLSSTFVKGGQDVWRNYVWMRGARAENERLRETVQQLLLLNSAYEQVRQENIRLRRLLALKETVTFETIGARVVARTPSYLAKVIYIDRGAADGVFPNAPVLSGNEIVGRVVMVSRYDSQVQLITNTDASIGAMTERTRSQGVLRGSGDLLMDLTYIANTEQVNVGDVILSSGLDGIYPKGLPIGKVVESIKGTNIYRSIKVRPSADLGRLEEVSILLSNLKPEKEGNNDIGSN